MPKALDPLHYMQHFRDMFDRRRSQGDEKHSFILTENHSWTVEKNSHVAHLKEVPTVMGIVVNFPFILNDNFIDLAPQRLHLDDPFHSLPWLRFWRYGGRFGGCSPRISRPTFRINMVALIQIREREKRGQHHDFQTLPV